MTEAEWLTATEPSVMLLFLRQRGTQRKLRLRNTERRLRLFAIACCRRIWSLMSDVCKSCVEVAERFADGLATSSELQSAERRLSMEGGGLGVLRACRQACDADMAGKVVSPVCHVSTNVIAVIFEQNHPHNTDTMAGFKEGACPNEERDHTALLRDIFGNPFRPVVLDTRWRSETAVALAAGIYEGRAFDRLPILADALEEAGCDHPDVLAHCRGPGPHVRGCWVVDAVLGKE